MAQGYLGGKIVMLGDGLVTAGQLGGLYLICSCFSQAPCYLGAPISTRHEGEGARAQVSQIHWV